MVGGRVRRRRVRGRLRRNHGKDRVLGGRGWTGASERLRWVREFGWHSTRENDLEWGKRRWARRRWWQLFGRLFLGRRLDRFCTLDRGRRRGLQLLDGYFVAGHHLRNFCVVPVVSTLQQVQTESVEPRTGRSRPDAGRTLALSSQGDTVGDLAIDALDALAARLVGGG
jgi:hypothetical protein